MGLFSRGRARAAGGPDAALPALTKEQADWLRGRLVTELARAGLPDARSAGDHVLAADGQVFGLANLAALVALLPRRRWAAQVRHHARSIVELQAFTEPTTLEEIAGIVTARVLADDPAVHPSTDDPAAAEPGPTLAQGLVVRACLHFPTHVSTLTDLAPFGGWSTVGPLAEANLRALPPPEHQQARVVEGGVVHLLSSGDLFGASRLLLLDELLPTLVGVERPAHGVLVAVPNRHLLALHVLDGPDVVGAMRLLMDLARAEHDGPGPVSPEVYYRSPDGILQQVTGAGDDGQARVVVTGAFAEAVRSLGVFG